MRAALALTLSLTLAIAAATAAAPEPVALPSPPPRLGPPVFVLTGGGYGHGVGLNQFGAFAQAQSGRGYRDILAFYYPETELVPARRAKVRVLLATGRRAATITAEGPLRVRDAAGVFHVVPSGRVTLKPGLRVVVGGVATKLAGPIAFVPSAQVQLALDGKPYRGELRVSVQDGLLQVVNHVGLDAYLRGVVPGEVPHEWPLEALKAQAVAARSYALANLVPDEAWDLYADVRSQVYEGLAVERPSTTRAVTETSGEVIAFAGKVATTYYYASSGGRTASSSDVFGIPLRYLQSRADPWDGVSPYHRWEPRRFSGRQLADAFGLASPVRDVASAPTPSRRPARVTLLTGADVTVTYLGAEVRERLGLRSNAFRLGVLRLSRPPASLSPGAGVQLAGLARDVEEPMLERLTEGTWERVVRLRTREDGSFAAVVRPRVSTRYRLSGSGLAGPAVTVTVAAAAGAS